MELRMLNIDLMGEVLGQDVQEFKLVDDNIEYVLMGDFDYWKTINIYEFMHSCKEWACTQGYDLLSKIDGGRGYVVVMEQRRTWISDTEVNAVIKACYHILKLERK